MMAILKKDIFAPAKTQHLLLTGLSHCHMALMRTGGINNLDISRGLGFSSNVPTFLRSLGFLV